MGDMTSLLAEQRIREYDLRLHHIDELLEHAESCIPLADEKEAVGAQLEKLKEERDRLAYWLYETKLKLSGNGLRHEFREAGPMAVWDAVARQVEELVERIEH